MLYPQDFEQKIGFDKIKQLTKDHCVSSLGVEFAEKIKWQTDSRLIKKWTKQTEEFVQIKQLEGGLLESNYIDCTALIKRASIDGTVLFEEELFDVKTSLKTIQHNLTFIKKLEPERFVESLALCQDIVIDKLVLSELDRVIDDAGQVRESASPELRVIRDKIKWQQNDLKKTMERLLKTAKNSGWIGDEMSVSVRDGRMVIPILAEHKRKLRGFVHDESATGQMYFVEPAEVLDANNELKELAAAERREIYKLLENLTSVLRPHATALTKAYLFMGLCDFISAKAKLAIDLDASLPVIVNHPFIDWKRAKHPLLYLNFKISHKKVVPLSIELDQSRRILLISGPNAGGKSVLLKTIGLIQYMFQCGYLVPLSPDSTLGVFKSIFMDMGDEQSIENDLSTYSSHLSNMRVFLQNLTKQSLFLIDEFGTGTEPALGGAIAEAILEKLVKTRAIGLINTHYTNLKTFADKTEGIENGGMRFDMQHLSPLFELEVGKPGSSYAFEVAQKMGLSLEVIENAKKKINKHQVNFEKLNVELEIEKNVYTEKNIELQRQLQKLKTQTEQYSGMKAYLESQKKSIINEAKTQSQSLIKEANKQIEATIRTIKETKAEKQKTQESRVILQEFAQQNLKTEAVKPPDNPDWQTETGPIEIGCFVKIKGQGGIGQVIALKNKDVEVLMGQIRSNIKLSRLERVSNKQAKQETKQIERRLGGLDLNEKMTNFSFNLDIRGSRGEEALGLVDNLINDAIMLSYNELRIVHGKGDGILRTLIRNHLKKSKFVASMADEHPDRGGAGVTIVAMK